MAGGRDARRGPASEPSELNILLAGLQAFVIKNYLPLAFFVAFVVALSWPWLGQQLLKPQVAGVHVITFINICIVFFISGLTLRTDELKDAFTRRTALGTLFGFVSILGLTPLLAFAVRDLPFEPSQFAAGLIIFCVVPTTLGVGVSLVTSAKGNVALAIFLTVTTNVLGVVIIPLWLKATLSAGVQGVDDLNISYLDIFVKLLLSFFVPTVIGKVMREYVPGVLPFVRAHKVALSITSNTNLALLIWQTMSGAQEQIVSTAFGTMLLVIVSIIIIHLIYLTFNTAVVRALRIPLPEALAVVILASQKSAPVAVTVITYITEDTVSQGLLAIPCVLGQLVQIFMDQPIAHYLEGRTTRWRAEQARQAEAAKQAEQQQQLAAGAPAGGDGCDADPEVQLQAKHAVGQAVDDGGLLPQPQA